MASPSPPTGSAPARPAAPAIPKRGPHRVVALLSRASFGPAGRWEKVRTEKEEGGQFKGSSSADRPHRRCVGASCRNPSNPPPVLINSLAFHTHTHTSQEDILDTMYWMRVLLALLGGVTAGLAGRTGAAVFFLHIAVNVVVVLAWARGVGVDDDDVGGLGGLVGEGLSAAIALFTLTWILTYTHTVAK